MDTPSWIDDRGDAVCVVGAGSSGLAAIKNLRQAGFAVDCYEREVDVGGAWNHRHDRSPVYASAHLISSKPFTQFPDFPMPDAYPDYPRHDQVYTYLSRYVDHFELRGHVWFGTNVVRIDPAADNRWDVTVRGVAGGAASRTLRYRAVIVANGHNWYAKLPSLPGQSDFAGEIIHASAYKDAAQLRGRRVLVVGSGNTGADIAVEGAQQATSTWLSSRRGYWYLPKYALGRPIDQVNDRMLSLRLPLRLRQWLARQTVRLVSGSPQRFGITKPDHRVYESHPLVNSLLPYHLGHGDIVAKPALERFTRDQAIFTDGSAVDPELVVFATGYLPSFEFLAADHLNVADGRPRLFMHMFTPHHKTLFVSGLIQPDAGQFGLVHWQTTLIAHWLRALTDAPERARKFWQRVVSEVDTRWTDGRVSESSRHWFEVSHLRYARGLERAINELEGSR